MCWTMKKYWSTLSQKSPIKYSKVELRLSTSLLTHGRVLVYTTIIPMSLFCGFPICMCQHQIIEFGNWWFSVGMPKTVNYNIGAWGYFTLVATAILNCSSAECENTRTPKHSGATWLVGISVSERWVLDPNNQGTGHVSPVACPQLLLSTGSFVPSRIPRSRHVLVLLVRNESLDLDQIYSMRMTQDLCQTTGRLSKCIYGK